MCQNVKSGGNELNIVFMGTPDFAVGCLESIINSNHTVKAVFSQPDKPVGRKQILTPPAVKQFAQENNIPVYQPETLKDGAAKKIIEEINPDCVVVVAYGKLIPESMLAFPKYGYVNVHASLLPEYRGSAPIQWAIVNGEEKTGVTTMQLDKGMDTGDILEAKELLIDKDETAGELFERLSKLGASLIISTLDKLEKGEITPIKQDESKATYAKIICKEMALIDFNNTATDINNLIRGFNPWPVAYTVYNSKRIKIFKAEVTTSKGEQPGTVIENSGKLTVACKDNTALNISQLQIEGAKRMNIADFLKGNKIPLNIKLGL